MTRYESSIKYLYWPCSRLSEFVFYLTQVKTHICGYSPQFIDSYAWQFLSVSRQTTLQTKIGPLLLNKHFTFTLLWRNSNYSSCFTWDWSCFTWGGLGETEESGVMERGHRGLKWGHIKSSDTWSPGVIIMCHISLDHNRNINLINWPTRHHCVFIIINFWLETVSSFYRNPTPWNDKIVFVGCRLQYCVLFLGINLIHGGLDNICLHPTVIKLALAPSLLSSSTFLHDLSHWSITWRYPIKIGSTTM